MDEMNGNNNETTANEKNANVKYIHGVPIYTEPTETAETKADEAKSADGANPFAEIPHGGVSRKMKKRTIALIIAVPVVLFLVYWFFIRFTPSVEVEGHKLTLTTKVKELDKMGLVLLDGDGNKVQYGTEIATKTFYGNTFEVYVNRDGAMKKSGVYVMIFNQYENTRKVEDCTFYMIRYYPKNQDAGVEVLINGQDLHGMSIVQASRLGIARTFQNIRLFDKMTVEENVRIGLHNQIKTPAYCCFPPKGLPIRRTTAE